MLLRQGEDGEAFGNVVLEPVGAAVGRATVGGDQTVEFLLRGLQRGGVPDPPQLGADPLADGGVGGVVNGVLREVELTALPETLTPTKSPDVRLRLPYRLHTAARPADT